MAAASPSLWSALCAEEEGEKAHLWTYPSVPSTRAPCSQELVWGGEGALRIVHAVQAENRFSIRYHKDIYCVETLNILATLDCCPLTLCPTLKLGHTFPCLTYLCVNNMKQTNEMVNLRP